MLFGESPSVIIHILQELRLESRFEIKLLRHFIWDGR